MICGTLSHCSQLQSVTRPPDLSGESRVVLSHKRSKGRLHTTDKAPDDW